MSSQTMVLEFGAREDMAMRLALTTTAQGTMSALGPLAGAIIASSLGYGVLFGVSIGFLVVGLIVLVTLVDEPRFRRCRLTVGRRAMPLGAVLKKGEIDSMRIGVPKEIKTLEFRIGRRQASSSGCAARDMRSSSRPGRRRHRPRRFGLRRSRRRRSCPTPRRSSTPPS